jgi:hypothetical protein
MLKDFFKYLIISVVTGIVVLFLRGWIAQEDWFVKRFGGDEEKRALKDKIDSHKTDSNQNLLENKSDYKKEETKHFSNTLYSKEKLERFIDRYMEISMSNRLKSYLDFFLFPLDRYFNQTDVSRDFVKKKRLKYIKKWINRFYEVKDIKVIKQKRDRVVIKITYAWKISSLTKELDGENILLMSLVHRNGKFYITSLEQY